MTIKAYDLTKRPPRSPRVRLGGYVILPRMLDKCRAASAGTIGEYKFDCPMDQHFLNFVGLKGDQIKQIISEGKSDLEVLEWITINATAKRSAWEIAQWAEYQGTRAPADVESMQWFAEMVQKIAPKREDISTWFDLLDVDDHVTFGGQA